MHSIRIVSKLPKLSKRTSSATPAGQGELLEAASMALDSNVRNHGDVYQELETWLDNDFLH